MQYGYGSLRYDHTRNGGLKKTTSLAIAANTTRAVSVQLLNRDKEAESMTNTQRERYDVILQAYLNQEISLDEFYTEATRLGVSTTQAAADIIEAKGVRQSAA